MKPVACPPFRETAVGCRVAAHACLRLTADGVAALRRDPGPLAKTLLTPSFLKHAEEQSIAGIAAVLHATTAAGWDVGRYTDWGVVAAANFLGRVGIAQTMQRFLQEGAWGVSPHLIPHHSLHAVSGTVSQALKIHGPNFGVGGGPNSAPDAFLAAATLLSDRRLPGLWLVLTGHESERIPAPAGLEGQTLPILEAVALALVPGSGDGLRLRVGLDEVDSVVPEFDLTSLVEELDQNEQAPAAKWRLSTTAWVELDTVAGEAQP